MTLTASRPLLRVESLRNAFTALREREAAKIAALPHPADTTAAYDLGWSRGRLDLLDRLGELVNHTCQLTEEPIP